MKQSFSHTKFSRFLKKRTKYIALPVMALIAISVIVLAFVAIMVMPSVRDAHRGIGADGFHAGIERGADLGVGKLVSKQDIVDTLGGKAESVGSADISKVFNLNGIRGQTLTYDFEGSDGIKNSLYIDKKEFDSTSTLNSANILANTTSAGKVGEFNAYFMHAVTFGSDREYYLLATKDLKAYLFALVQPSRHITISEVSAVAVLKRLALKTNL